MESSPHISDEKAQDALRFALQESGTCAPFFAIDGPNVSPLRYIFLARELGPDQPFYGIQAIRDVYYFEENSRDEIEALARGCIRAMRKIQPHGPYFIGGKCGGAHIASEMARQLDAQGHTIGLLVAFDTWASDTDRTYNCLRNMHRKATWIRTLHNEDRLGATILRKLRELLSINRGRTVGNRNRLTLYEPEPFTGPVAVFRVRWQPYYRRFTDRTLGWRRINKEVRVYSIPGNHLNCLESSQARGLARTLAAALRRVQEPAGNPSN